MMMMGIGVFSNSIMKEIENKTVQRRQQQIYRDDEGAGRTKESLPDHYK